MPLFPADVLGFAVAIYSKVPNKRVPPLIFFEKKNLTKLELEIQFVKNVPDPT